MIEDIVFDALERQRARGVEAQCLQVAGDEFHRCHAALPHLGHEDLAGFESGAGAPEAKPGSISQVGDIGRASGRDVENAGSRQQMLEADAADALFGPLDRAARAGGTGGIGHGVRLVEDDEAFEGGSFGVPCPEPGEDLVKAAALVGPRRAQCRIGGEQDAAIHRDGITKPPIGQGLDVDADAA